MIKTKIALMTMAVVSFGIFAHAQTQAGSAATTTAASAPGLTDGQIFHIMKTANEGEVDLAKVAKSKANNKDVKAFANMMIDEHKKNEKEGKDVAKKAKVDVTKNDTSKTLEDMVNTQEKDLKKLKGAEFDKAYIGQQITMHKQLLDDLNQKLIPAAQNPQLKAYLETTKSHVETHLTRAQEISSSLNTTK